MTRRITRNLVKVKDIQKLGTQVSQVNDLVNDLGNDSYIRREKDYHCLTDNIKTIISDNQTLLSVANDNKNNKATLSPKHDSQKEQVLQGVGELIKITNGKNASTEKTQVEVLSDDTKANVSDLPTVTSSDESVTITKNNNVYDLKVPKVNTSKFALKTDLPPRIIIKDTKLNFVENYVVIEYKLCYNEDNYVSSFSRYELIDKNNQKIDVTVGVKNNNIIFSYNKNNVISINQTITNNNNYDFKANLKGLYIYYDNYIVDFLSV